MRILVMLVLFLSVHWNPVSAHALDDRGLNALRTLSEILHHISERYVHDIDDHRLVEGAILGIVDRLDAHSHFFPPEALNQFKDSAQGRFGGVGLEVTKKRRWLVVVAPVDDSPAMRAGMRAGDRITKIDRQSTKDMSVHEAIRALRGKPGSSVVVTVMRSGKAAPFNVRLRREVLTLASVTTRWLEPGYPVIRVSSFQERTYADFHAALQTLEAQETVRGLIIDVRNNPGGVLSQGIAMVDHFLRDGVIITRMGRGKEMGRYEATNNGQEPGYPVVVLVNGGSASASEVLAGALQDRKRALVVGTQSFGKGSVQLLLDLDDGAALKMTISHYYTPSKRIIHGVGITPDVIVDDVAPQERLRASSDRTRPVRRAKKRGRMRLKVPELELAPGISDYQRAVALALLQNGTVARVTKFK